MEKYNKIKYYFNHKEIFETQNAEVNQKLYSREGISHIGPFSY